MNLGTLTAILAIVDKISPAVSGISGNVGSAMGKIKGAIAGAFAVEAVTAAIGKFTDFTGRVTDTAAKLGISTSAVQKFELAFQDAGVSIDTVGNAIGEMGRRLVEGDSGAVHALGQLGLKASELKQMAPDQAFTKVADAVASIQNPMERATAAQEIFGKGGKEMLAALDGKLAETTQGFEDMGLIMSEDVVAAGDALGDSLGHLSSAGMNLLGVVLMPILPLLTTLVDYLGQAAQVASVVVQWFGKHLLEAFSRAKEAVFSFLSNLAETASKVPLLGSAFRGIGDAATWLKDKAVQAGSALKETYAGMRLELQTKTEPAVRSVAAVVGTYGKAVDEANKQQKEFNESVKFMATAGGNWQMWQQYAHTALDTATQDAFEFEQQFRRVLTAIDLSGNGWEPFKQGVQDSSAEIGVMRDKWSTQSEWASMGSALADTIVGALQGGGSALQAAAARLGQMIGQKIGAEIGKAIGGTSGSGIGSALGSILGTFMASYVQFVAKNDQMRAMLADLKNSLTQSSGGMESFADRARAANIDIEHLFRITDLEKFQRELKKVQDQLDEQDRAHQRALDAMERYGLTIEQAGLKFKQSEMNKGAKGLMEDFMALADAGFDVDLIIEKMGGSVNDFVKRSMKMGTQVPAEMKPLLARMIEMGVLLDENGNKITDIGEIPFAETMTSAVMKIVDKMGELIGVIQGGLGGALNNLPKNIDINVNTHYNSDGDPGGGGSDAPGFAHGSAGIRDFGRGTWAILHGRERVQTEAQMRAEQSSGGGGVVVHVDARGALMNDYASQMTLADIVGDAVIRRLGLRGRVNVAGAY